jgi:hypothetical protein
MSHLNKQIMNLFIFLWMVWSVCAERSLKNEVIENLLASSLTVVAGNGVISYTGNGGQATSASLYRPLYPVIDSTGNIYMSENGGFVIRKFTVGKRRYDVCHEHD